MKEITALTRVRINSRSSSFLNPPSNSWQWRIHKGGGGMGRIAPHPRGPKIIVNVSENKSSGRQKTLSNSLRVVRLLCRIAISKFWENFDPLNRDRYQRHPTATSLEAWMISRAYFNIHRVVYHAINFTFWVFTKTLLPLHKMHYYSSFWGASPSAGWSGGLRPQAPSRALPPVPTLGTQTPFALYGGRRGSGFSGRSSGSATDSWRIRGLLFLRRLSRASAQCCHFV